MLVEKELTYSDLFRDRHILRLLTDEWDGFTEETKNLRNEKVGSTGGVRELREICASVKKDKVSALEGT